MPYTATIKRYLRSLQSEYEAAIRGGQHTAELSFRTPMDTLFRALAHDLNPGANHIDIVLEPRNQGRVGRPDWRIHDNRTLGIYGYIEGKGLSAETFDITPYTQQINRYLTLGHKLMESVPVDFYLQNFAKPFDEENQELILSDGTNKIRVYCPITLQHLNISGYDVIKNSWLKFNSYDYTHCSFDKDDMRKLLDFLNTLATHAKYVAQLDDVVREILIGNVELIQPQP